MINTGQCFFNEALKGKKKALLLYVPLQNKRSSYVDHCVNKCVLLPSGDLYFSRFFSVCLCDLPQIEGPDVERKIRDFLFDEKQN